MMMGGIALALSAALAQEPRDTLVYNVALQPQSASLAVEARLTNHGGGPVSLLLPPAAGRAGTTLSGIGATDDRGVALPARRTGTGYTIDAAGPGAVRFRYRIDFRDRVADGSTGSGFDASRLYAVTGSLFVAPDAIALRKTSGAYPLVRLAVLVPAGWQVVTGFERVGGEFRPRDGEELVGGTIAAAPDFRIYRDSAGGAPFTVAIRGRRYFTDSLLHAVVATSLRKGAQTLGPVPVARVTYTSDMGRKGRTSGSLQGFASIGLIWEPSEVLERARAHDTFHETLHLWFGGAMESDRWWTEGITDYFAARLYADWQRDPAELAALSFESYHNYLNIAHNTRLTMAQEARQGMGGDNTELLVYRKGMLAGLMLDAAIRRASDGRASLDDVARRALALAATRRSRSVREAEIRQLVREVGGNDAARTWERVVEGTAMLTADDLTSALRVVTGRTFTVPDRPKRRKTLTGTPAARTL